MDKTSRLWILDAIEALVNNIQLASHIQEHLDNWEAEKEMYYIHAEVVTLRRQIMKKIENDFGADHQYRCMVKHAIASRWFLQEVKDAAYGWEKLYNTATENMFMILSKFLKQEITDCWRCLLDSLQATHGVQEMPKEDWAIESKDKELKEEPTTKN